MSGLAGIVFAREGGTKREAGVEVRKVGPLKAWRLDCEGAAASLRIKTELAEYACGQPAPTYKKVFVHLKDRADVAFEVLPRDQSDEHLS